jgi:hypothetical protein
MLCVICSVWKSKTRRLLNPQDFESNKSKKKAAVATSSESNTVVVKPTVESVQLSEEDISALYLEGTAIPVNTRMIPFLFSVLESARGQTKEPARKKKKQEGDSAHDAVAVAGGKSKKILVTIADCPNSSDEESEDVLPGMAVTQKRSSVAYRTVPDYQKAKVPKVWPPQNLGDKPQVNAEPVVPTPAVKKGTVAISSNLEPGVRSVSAEK